MSDGKHDSSASWHRRHTCALAQTAGAASRRSRTPSSQVDTTTLCDTHSAIKCRCDGTTATAAAKQAAARAAAAAAKAAAAAAAAADTDAAGGDGDGERGSGGGGEGKDAHGAGVAGGKGKDAGKGKDEHGDAAVDDGIMQWAHLNSCADSPDPVWAQVSSFIRDKFTTYLFSDHIINDQQQHVAEQEGEEQDEEEEEGEREEQEGRDGDDDVCYAYEE